MSSSRPASLAILAAANRPTLQDILSNQAPPPWTLSAFMAYLSQNHCLETLEFTMEAMRYTECYNRIIRCCSVRRNGDADQVGAMWQKLMNAYIQPAGPREVNLPSHVRDRLLSIVYTDDQPPAPSELDEAVTIIYELMNDSVLLPFLESTNVAHTKSEAVEEEHRSGRSLLRLPRELSSSSSEGESSRSPKMGFLPHLGLGRRSEGQARSPSLSDAADREALSDASAGSASPDGEPLTPPTTPPTADWGLSSSTFGTSLQKVVGPQASWKRVSAKLGFGKTRSTRRPNISSAPQRTLDEDVTMADSDSVSSAASTKPL